MQQVLPSNPTIRSPFESNKGRQFVSIGSIVTATVVSFVLEFDAWTITDFSPFDDTVYFPSMLKNIWSILMMYLKNSEFKDLYNKIFQYTIKLKQRQCECVCLLSPFVSVNTFIQWQTKSFALLITSWGIFEEICFANWFTTLCLFEKLCMQDDFDLKVYPWRSGIVWCLKNKCPNIYLYSICNIVKKPLQLIFFNVIQLWFLPMR